MTRWAKDVSPNNALPEYPRMQMVRKDWLNLNGLWDIKLADGTNAKILVPYPVESALSGVMKHSDRLTYRRTFEVPAAWRGKRVLLHFGAVDWRAEVFINGQAVGKHEGGYAPFSFDVSSALKKDGPQEVVVNVWDPTDFGTQPRGKQVDNPSGIFYTSVSGIWQTVWLEPVGSSCITGIKAVSDIQTRTVVFTIQAEGGTSDKVTIQCKALRAKVSGRTGEPIAMSVSKAKLWSPDAPTLYPITVKLASGDTVQSYFAMRKTSVGKDKDGIMRMMLNDEFIFQHGPLDQGWWPDGLYTAPTDAALQYDLKMLKSMGFNMLRKHVKVEPARFYYHCDQMGVLVWQDMPSRSVGGDGTMVPGFDPFGGESGKADFEREWKEIIEAFQFFPCIVMWVPFNEGWGQYDTERIAAWTKALDPTRLVNNASGWVDKNCGNIVDMHNYNGPAMSPVEETRASVLGEYGAFSPGFRGHVWKEKGNSVEFSPENQNALFNPYNLANKEIHRLIGKGLSAAVYTQLTDVEDEVNGLMSYDREVVKMPLEKLAASNRALNIPPPKVKALIPNAQEKAQMWSYTTDSVQAGTNWFAEDFDDSAWKKGLGGFGHVAEHRGAVVGTKWDTKDIWIRRTVELSAEDLAHPERLFFDFYYDENVEIYLNGTLACKLTHGPNRYVVSPLSPQTAKALRAGKNLIAAHGSTTQIEVTRWQNIDIGLSRNLDVKTLLFLGDSITAAGGYVRIIEAELANQPPMNSWKVINRGLGSETVSGLSEPNHPPGPRPCLFARLDKELAEVKPDWVVACYGINDGIYHPFNKERFAAYQAGIETLIRKVHASGAHLVLLTAPPYARPGLELPKGTRAQDATKLLARLNAEGETEAEKDPRKFGYICLYPYYDYVMAQYAKWLLSLNDRNDVHVIDLRTPMLADVKAAYEGTDGVHPSGVGHEIMARAFLLQWPLINAAVTAGGK